MRKVRSRLSEKVSAKSQELGFEITQAQISRATGIRQPTVSAWMSKKPLGRIDIKVLSAFCDYFDCALWDMLEVEGDPLPDEEEEVTRELVA